MSLDYQKYLLEKTYEQTPSEITEHIRQLSQAIAPNSEPVFSEFADGTGWIIREWPRVLIEARSHAGAAEPGSLFLPDSSEVFETDAVQVRRALGDDPSVVAYVALLDQFDALCRESAADGKWSLSNERVMDITKLSDKIHNAKIDVITWLFETTAPDASCFCASGQPFKACCHAALTGPA